MVSSSYRMVERVAVAALLCGLVCTTASHADTILFVDDDAPPGGDGLSWDTAFRTVQGALAAALDRDVIRVAQGIYRPDEFEVTPDGTGDREESFRLIDGVEVLGGYAGLGKADDPNDHDPELYQTILSGDLLEDDTAEMGNMADNSRHVVRFTDVQDPAVLDGVIITRGNANGNGFPYNGGGGLLIEAGNAVIRNCVFINNDAQEHAAVGILGDCTPIFESVSFASNPKGAIHIEGAPVIEGEPVVTLIDCSFVGRGAGSIGLDLDGGQAILQGCSFEDLESFAVRNEEGRIFVESCTFAGNVERAVYTLDAESEFIDCLFVGNFTDTYDGGGALYNQNSTTTVINCVFEENIARVGGAISDVVGELTVIGCYFARNRAEDGSSGFAGAIKANSATVIDSTFDQNRALGWAGAVGIGDGTLENCVFTDNEAAWQGGGAIYSGGNVTARNCRFIGNNARWGGAWAEVLEGEAMITNCQFIGNSTDVYGGSAIACWTSASVTLSGCLIAGNHAAADSGGAVASWFDSNATLLNCTVFGNSSTGDGGGVYIGDAGGEGEVPSFATVANCVVWGNTDQNTFGGRGNSELSQIFVDPDVPGSSVSLNYSCIEGLTGMLGGVGNIGENPLFVDPDGPDNVPGTEDDDLRLGAGSPSIDAGFNNAVPMDVADLDNDGDFAEFLPFDFDGEPRFSDDARTDDTGCGAPAIVDMGAYEFHGIPIQPVRGDISGDLLVDGADLLELLGAWGECPAEDDGADDCCAGDLNADGVVDGGDLLLMLGNWS